MPLIPWFTALVRLASAVALLLAALGPAHPALAVPAGCSLQVTNTNDSGAGSLRAAIACATAGQSVTFSPALAGSIIHLTTGEITITQPITVDGSAAPDVTVDAGYLSRIFNITAPGLVTLQGLIVQHGRADSLGGAVLASDNSPLVLNQTSVLSSTVRGAGAGVYAGSLISLNGGRIQGNACSANACAGGGLWANGGLTLTDTQIISNTGTNYGGGVIANGPVTLNRGRFEGNIGTSAAGLKANNSVILTDTVFINNIATSGSGGGMIAQGPVLVTGGRFERNACTYVNCSGGAIQVNFSLVVSGTVFVANTSQLVGGAVYAISDATLNGARFDGNTCTQSGCLGGGMYAGWATVTNSSWHGNGAAHQGGGLYVRDAGALSLANVTLAGNWAGVGGGGLYVAGSGQVSLLNVTVADNQAPSGGGLWAEVTATVGVTNTIFSNNGAVNCAGEIDWGSTNLEWPGNSCATAGPSADFSTTDPLLDIPAANPPNGSFTYGLLANSPARDAGDTATCAGPLVNNRDQRGQARPFDGDAVPGAICDIGAFEAAGPIWYLLVPLVLR